MLCQMIKLADKTKSVRWPGFSVYYSSIGCVEQQQVCHPRMTQQTKLDFVTTDAFQSRCRARTFTHARTTNEREIQKSISSKTKLFISHFFSQKVCWFFSTFTKWYYGTITFDGITQILSTFCQGNNNYHNFSFERL